jgi:hypothetical protein
LNDSPPTPGNELTAFLWVTAAFIAVMEIVWWIFDRMYST